MSRIEKIEQEIKGLSRRELAEFRDWFQEYEAAEWDRQIEADAKAGKLDRLAEAALAQHREGRSREI